MKIASQIILKKFREGIKTIDAHGEECAIDALIELNDGKDELYAYRSNKLYFPLNPVKYNPKENHLFLCVYSAGTESIKNYMGNTMSLSCLSYNRNTNSERKKIKTIYYKDGSKDEFM